MNNLKETGLRLRTLRPTDYASLVEDIQYNFLQILNLPGFKGLPGASVTGPPGVGQRGSTWIFTSVTDFPEAASINDIDVALINNLYLSDAQAFNERLVIPGDSTVVYGDSLVLPAGTILQLTPTEDGDRWIDSGISFSQVASLTTEEITRLVQSLMSSTQDSSSFKYYQALAKNVSDASPAQNVTLTTDAAIDVVVSGSGPGYAMSKHKFFAPEETNITEDMFLMMLTGPVQAYHKLVQRTQTERTNAYIPGVDDWANFAMLQNSYNNGLIFGHQNASTLYDFGRLYKNENSTVLTSHYSPLESEFSELNLSTKIATIRSESEIALRSGIFRTTAKTFITPVFSYAGLKIRLGTAANTSTHFDSPQGVFLENVLNAPILSTDMKGKIVSKLALSVGAVVAMSDDVVVTTRYLLNFLIPLQQSVDQLRIDVSRLMTIDWSLFMKATYYVTSQSRSSAKNLDNYIAENSFAIFKLAFDELSNQPVSMRTADNSGWWDKVAYMKTYISVPADAQLAAKRVVTQELYTQTMITNVPNRYTKHSRVGYINQYNSITWQSWIESPIDQGKLVGDGSHIVIEDNIVKHTRQNPIEVYHASAEKYVKKIKVDSTGHITKVVYGNLSVDGVGSVVGSYMEMSIQMVPHGYLPCFGQYVRSVYYPDLRGRLGTSFGSLTSRTAHGAAPLGWYHDPATNPYDVNEYFKLPDLRGQFIRGANISNWELLNNAGVPGATNVFDYGRVVGSTQRSLLQYHKHISVGGEAYVYNTRPDGSRWSPFGYVGGTGNPGMGESDFDNILPLTNDGRPEGSGTVKPSGGNPNPEGQVGNETRPMNIAALICIKCDSWDIWTPAGF